MISSGTRLTTLAATSGVLEIAARQTAYAVRPAGNSVWAPIEMARVSPDRSVLQA
jgi:hypothetical protein